MKNIGDFENGGGWEGMYSRYMQVLGLLTEGASQNSRLEILNSQIRRVRRIADNIAHRTVRS